MSEVKVLVQGYAINKKEGHFASSSVVLIKEGKLNIIVDPGIDRKALLNALKKEKISPKDIDFVILTHTHLDHSMLTGIFENSKILDDGECSSFDGKLVSHDGKVPKTNIQIIKTPGHDMFHCSVLAKDKKLGNVVAAGDIFWWKDGEECKTDIDSLMKHKDPYVKNQKQLDESRKKILKIADYIIPGHGRMFKIKK